MIPESTRRAGPLEGNGIVTTFAFGFKTNAAADLRVVKLALGVETTLVLDSHYSVALNADQEASPGGDITYPISGSPLAADEFLTIISDLAIEQQTDLPNLGAFYPAVIESALDRAIMLIGQQQEVLDRSITLQASVSGVAVELPTPSANLAIGWNATGDALANIASPGSLTSTATGLALLNAASAAAARTILGSTTVGDAVFIAANAAAGRTALALGTVATLNTGTASGNVPVLDANGKIASAVQSRQFQPLSAGVATNILTFTLAAGALLEFSDGTASLLAAAITLAVPDTATLGTSNGVAARLWVVAVKNGGTPELAVINTWDSTNVFEILPTDSITTVAMTTGADLAHTWYSTTLRAAQAIAVVGYIEITQATAGTWATTPSLTQGWGFGVPLPGQPIQTRRTASGAYATNSTLTPFDDTIPQVTEGSSYLTCGITPRSALNLLELDALWVGTNAGAVLGQTVHLHQTGVNDALAAVTHSNSGANQMITAALNHRRLAGSASALTFDLRAGNSASTATHFNGSAGARVMGGVCASYLQAREIQR